VGLSYRHARTLSAAIAGVGILLAATAAAPGPPPVANPVRIHSAHLSPTAAPVSIVRPYAIATTTPKPAALTNPSCPSAKPHSFVGWIWRPSTNDVYGMRAPVQIRIKTLLCVPVSDEPFATGWIAVESGTGSGITQAGIIHEWVSGKSRWCRVWATGVGAQHIYDCSGNPSDGTYVYFKIIRYFDTPTRTYRYEVEDCGTGGSFSGCKVLNSSQAAYGSPLGIVSAETNYPCTVRIMGSHSAPQNYGTSTHPIQGLASSWGNRTWNYQREDDSCPSDYKGAQSSGRTSALISTWDSRN
jgi:hypothetical protein